MAAFASLVASRHITSMSFFIAAMSTPEAADITSSRGLGLRRVVPERPERHLIPPISVGGLLGGSAAPGAPWRTGGRLQAATTFFILQSIFSIFRRLFFNTVYAKLCNMHVKTSIFDLPVRRTSNLALCL